MRNDGTAASCIVSATESAGQATGRRQGFRRRLNYSKVAVAVNRLESKDHIEIRQEPSLVISEEHTELWVVYI